MFASFLSHKTSQLSLLWVIVVGTFASTFGDNIGFWLGRHFGETFISWMKKIFRLDDDDIGAAKRLVNRHGPMTVFFARFIFGLRTITGPLTGTLGMEWKKFTIFNFLGAAAWVTSMACLGYLFSNTFETLLDYFEKASWGIAGVLFLTGYLIWRHYKKKYKEDKNQNNSQEEEAA